MWPVSKLYDRNTFDKQFLRDISKAKKRVIIESPFIRLGRIHQLLPTLSRLRRRGVRIIINTRSPNEHDGVYIVQAQDAVDLL